MLYSTFRYLPAGDSAVVVEMGGEICPEINYKIREFVATLDRYPLKGLREIIPTYRSVLVLYDPAKILFDEVCKHLRQAETRLAAGAPLEARCIEIPVAYGGEFGPDLEFVAEHNHLTRQEVVDLHSGREYLVYMLGFTPGFCYLGGMSPRLETPRLATPRTRIPAGSVGIAGQQTGMYPIDSPGGWRLIGRSPFRLFDPQRDPPVLVRAGDYVRFIPIDPEGYENVAT